MLSALTVPEEEPTKEGSARLEQSVSADRTVPVVSRISRVTS
jgi:hypothetical protein